MPPLKARRLGRAFWPTVFTVPAMLVLIGLGSWQVERLHWKEDLIATRTARLAAPPMALPAGPVDIEESKYRRLRVTGTFRHEAEMYLAVRSLRGNPGFHVVTPLVTAGGDAVLVDRGWVPLDRKAPESRAEGQPSGTVIVEGVVRAGGAKGWFTPDNEPDKNVWFYVDIQAMAAHAGLEMVRGFYLEAGPEPNPGGLPIGGEFRVEVRNEHLGYALIWYALALALLVIYVLYLKRGGAPGREIGKGR